MSATAPQHRFRFAVRLTPKGGRDAIAGWRTDANEKPVLAVRVSAPAENGKANAALVGLLARTLDIAKSKIRIVTGASSRLKIVEIDGAPDAVARLAAKVPA